MAARTARGAQLFQSASRCLSQLLRLNRPHKENAAALALVVLGLLLSCATVRADCIDYGEFLHPVGGYYISQYNRLVYDVDVSGTYAYAAVWYRGVQVIDVSDPSDPQPLGACAAGSAHHLVVSGSHVLINASPGLRIVDATDPNAPLLVGTLDVPDLTLDLDASGNYAYLTDRSSGLLVVDIEDPQNPQIVATLDALGAVEGIALGDQYAYVTADSGLRVVDITDPLDPQLAGSVDLGLDTWAVATFGSLACVIGYPELFTDPTLFVIDVSDPRNPQVLGSIDPPEGANDVTMSGTHAYVAGEGLQDFDLSDPYNPQFLGISDPDNEYANCHGLTVSEGFVYVAVAGNWEPPLGGGVEVFAVGDSPIPEAVGSIDDPHGTYNYDVAVSGSHAYLAHEGNALQVVDISVPQDPQIVGSVYAPGYPSAVAIAEPYAYVATYRSGLHVIDISDPQYPHLAGSVHTPDWAYGVAVSGDYAYVGNGYSGLQVVDIADPQNPVLVDSVATPTVARGVAISGAYAYVADYDSGLLVIDISDPFNSQIVASVDTPHEAWDVALAGHYAYVADGAGLQVIDIQNPQAPQLLGSANTPYCAVAVALSRTFAYVATWSGLGVVDITSPESPRLVGGVNNLDEAFGVAVSESHVCVSRYGGLDVLPLQCPSASVDPSVEAIPNLSVRSFPNPGCHQATLHLELPATTRALASIHDVTGRRVRALLDGTLRGGPHELPWDGLDDEGSPVAAGIYLVRIMTADGARATGRVLIVR